MAHVSRIRRTMARGLFAALLLCMTLPSAAAAAPGTPLVFAAASLSDVLKEVGTVYQTKTGSHVEFSFAASSTLAKQIAASGGADIFVSADEDWMTYLQQRGLLSPNTRENLLANRLVLIEPASAKTQIAIGKGFPLLQLLHGGRLAMAEPETVPAGKYGRAALTALGVWQSVSNRLARAENVRAALAYVARGETPLGIVYETDAIAEPGVRIAGVFPADTHPPIIYPAALVKGAKAGAKPFLAFLNTPEAAAIFRKYGFSVLGGTAQ